jgi:bifunctional DNase/RNase
VPVPFLVAGFVAGFAAALPRPPVAALGAALTAAPTAASTSVPPGTPLAAGDRAAFDDGAHRRGGGDPRFPPGHRPPGHRPPGRQPDRQIEQPVVDAAATPRGFLQMFVAAVLPTGDAHTVVLVNAAEEVLLPVGVALPEALSIFGRLEQKTAPRPLTHDLLDQVVGALGAEVVAVHLDDLKDEAGLRGIVLLRRQGETALVALDARPPDAVAVALSAHAPIFVARPVLERDALTRQDVARVPPAPPGPDAEAAAVRVWDL